MSYNAPTSLGNLVDRVLIEDVPADIIDFESQVQVVGDDHPLGGTWTVQGGTVPAGMTRTGGIVFGTPTTPQAETRLTLRFTNSGGFVDVWCDIIVQAAAPAGFGPDMVENGTFTGNTDSWAAAISATINATGNVLNVVSGGVANGQARDSFAVVAGRTYRVWARFAGGTAAGTHLIRLGATAGATTFGSLTATGGTVDGARRYVDIVPTGTSLFLTPINPSAVAASTALYDDIEVREVLTVSAPVPYTNADWTLVNAASLLGDQLTLDIDTFRGVATDYRVGTSGAWIDTGLTAAGVIQITGLTRETAATIYLRSRGSTGVTATPDSRTATPQFASNVRFARVGGNNAAAGTWAAPWATYLKLCQTLTAGQVGYVGPGQWASAALTNSGTTGNRIVISTLP